MIHWKSFGASVVGPAHVAESKPNQDAWVSFHSFWGDCIAVSDGLGSKPFSNLGSHAACHAAKHAFHACRDQTEVYDGVLSNEIKTNWLSRIAPLKSRDCAATCLFAMRLGDGMFRMAMLGDGLVATLKVDGSIVSLTEDKSQGFSNITAALSSKASSQDWRHLTLKETECDAILLFTDGISDDLEDLDGFVKGFVQGYRNLATLSANRHIRAMLTNWPTPKHSDDKTIVCLCREESPDA